LLYWILAHIYIEQTTPLRKERTKKKSFDSVAAVPAIVLPELEIHNEWFDGLDELERADEFSYYINAYAAAFDPHTQYFPPQQQEAFEIEMTGQLEGIGAQLQQDGEFVTIASIVTGSACWRQGELEVGDKLLKVAQGDAQPEDVVGMRVNKVVTRVRGKKGTEVRLTVRKKDGTEKVIPIVRDIVEMEATFARSAMLGNQIGYIRLPKFYVDFFDESNRDCAEDVRTELRALKAAGARGIIFDLRGNGGGSLPACGKHVVGTHSWTAHSEVSSAGGVGNHEGSHESKSNS